MVPVRSVELDHARKVFAKHDVFGEYSVCAAQADRIQPGSSLQALHAPFGAAIVGVLWRGGRLRKRIPPREGEI